MKWKAYKNYTSAEKKAVADSVAQFPDISAARPSPQLELHGKPVKWDRIIRFSRSAQGPRRRRRPTGVAPIGEKLRLDLHLDSLQPTVNAHERVLFLTKSYLDWNVSSWYPLGFAKHQPPSNRHTLGLEIEEYHGHRGDSEGISRRFNKCFYDAIPLLLTNRTSEAFKEISLACSLASHCLQHSPYWIFLRLLRLYSYPLWGRFSDVRRQIITFLQALASRTLPNGHTLRHLLELWAQEDIGSSSEHIASLLRLSSDALGPSSGLDPEEWAWIQDEICSLSYQRKEFHDALRLARKLSEDPNVPHGVHITSQQMIARYHLHYDNVNEAERILLSTKKLIADCKTEEEKARFSQQTFSDLGYIHHIKGDRVRSLLYYEAALKNATQVQNIANMSSLRCRVQALDLDKPNQGGNDEPASQTQSNGQNNSSWALWAFCRPYS